MTSVTVTILGGLDVYGRSWAVGGFVAALLVGGVLNLRRQKIVLCFGVVIQIWQAMGQQPSSRFRMILLRGQGCVGGHRSNLGSRFGEKWTAIVDPIRRFSIVRRQGPW